MLAAERGAAVNTLAAYRRDLEGAADILGDLAQADAAALGGLGGAWADLAPASLARKCSALRQWGLPERSNPSPSWRCRSSACFGQVCGPIGLSALGIGLPPWA
jgi:hypothetical protein